MQVDTGIVEVSSTSAPSCARFSHPPLTLPWPSLRRGHGLLVSSTGHLSLIRTSLDLCSHYLTCQRDVFMFLGNSGILRKRTNTIH